MSERLIEPQPEVKPAGAAEVHRGGEGLATFNAIQAWMIPQSLLYRLLAPFAPVPVLEGLSATVRAIDPPGGRDLPGAMLLVQLHSASLAEARAEDQVGLTKGTGLFHRMWRSMFLDQVTLTSHLIFTILGKM